MQQNERDHSCRRVWNSPVPAYIGDEQAIAAVYDKPMVYYPLSTLMLAGIREVLIITSPDSMDAFQRLLGDGSQWGMKFSFAEQSSPRGLADAFIIGREFIDCEPVALILGDNIIYSSGLVEKLKSAAQNKEGAVIFADPVRDPERYGVVEFEDSGQVLSIEEKPKNPRSNFAVPGIYFFDEKVCKEAENQKPSKRGELEITDLIQKYLDRDQLRVEVLGRGIAWLDAGTQESLLQAANFVQVVEERQGWMISCPEEIAYRMGYIDKEMLRIQAEKFRPINMDSIY